MKTSITTLISAILSELPTSLNQNAFPIVFPSYIRTQEDKLRTRTGIKQHTSWSHLCSNGQVTTIRPHICMALRPILAAVNIMYNTNNMYSTQTTIVVLLDGRIPVSKREKQRFVGQILNEGNFLIVCFQSFPILFAFDIRKNAP